MPSLTVVFRRLSVTLALVLCLVPRPGQAQDPALSAELWAEAEAFRVFASGDFLFALQASSTPEANLKFAELGGLLWPGRADADAWSIFFRHTLINFIAGGYEVETVIFQHPWADVALLTGWARSPEDGQMRIVDLGMVMGSVARGADRPFPVGRGWMVEPLYAPEAVGRLNARTTLAIADFEAGETEHPLAVLGEDDIWAMISGAELQLMEHQTDILPLVLDEPGTARAMRFAWNEVMAAAQQGRLKDVLPPTAPVAALSAVDPALWATLEPVAYLETDTGAVALHASWRNPDIYAALQVRGDDRQAQITAFDLYSFSGFLAGDAQ